MKKYLESTVVTTGLAIFSMLFGAGNLMFPLQVGLDSGDKIFWGLSGFMITAVFLPIIGFVGMMLFNGNYEAFFNRLGKPVGTMLTCICMLIIGPALAIPRITTLSHTMIAPFLPWSWLSAINPSSSFVFALIFLGVTFMLTYQKGRIIDILGKIIGPLLLLSLCIIIIKGFFSTGLINHTSATAGTVFINNLQRGYETLDLLAALFFSSIVLSVLKNKIGKQTQFNPHQLAIIGLKAGMVGVSLLGLVYIGMGFLGMYHGAGLENAGNQGELFRDISFRVLGAHGAFVIATAVLMACLSMSIALAAVVADYLHNEVFQKKISYFGSLIIVLLACVPLSTAGLTRIAELTSGIIIYVGYPVLITLTLANIAYKLLGVKMVKIPVAVTFVVALASYLW